MPSIVIRPAREQDAPALLAVYTPYVEQTAVSFELTAPTADAFRDRVRQTLTAYPYLVAEEEGRVLGYAYAGRFRPRAAFACSAEVSIYLSPVCHRRGIGRRLYAALEDRLRTQGVTNLYAVIAAAAADDPYLPRGSEEFHRAAGYRPVGRYTGCGCKFGRRYDVVVMEKLLDPPEET